ncbi:predicted protein [Brucella melitensis bv. 3 str. Ether]|nr:predicted protein [Brucella melitensis bv. 3 str. Ether]
MATTNYNDIKGKSFGRTHGFILTQFESVSERSFFDMNGLQTEGKTMSALLFGHFRQSTHIH